VNKDNTIIEQYTIMSSLIQRTEIIMTPKKKICWT